MSASKKRTKSGKNRIVLDPRACITKRLPLDESQKRDIGLPVNLAIEAMRTGHGDMGQAWGILASSINVAVMLCEVGVGENVLDEMKKAQAGLVRCKHRAHRTGVWAFDGEGLRDVTEAIGLHEQQLAIATTGQIAHALKIVKQRVEDGEVFE